MKGDKRARSVIGGPDSVKDMKMKRDTIIRRAEVEQLLFSEEKLKCPKTISPIAKKEWSRVMKAYKKMGAKILNALDMATMTMYCEAVATYTVAQQQWIEKQKVFSDDKDEARELSRIVQVMMDMSKLVIQLSEQLCLSPVGRAKMGVTIAKKDEGSSVMKLLQTSDDDDDEEEE